LFIFVFFVRNEEVGKRASESIIGRGEAEMDLQ